MLRASDAMQIITEQLRDNIGSSGNSMFKLDYFETLDTVVATLYINDTEYTASSKNFGTAVEQVFTNAGIEF